MPHTTYRIYFLVELSGMEESFPPLILNFPGNALDDQKGTIQCPMYCYRKFKLNCRLNLKDLARNLPTVIEYRRGVLLQLRRPNVKAFILNSGKVLVSGPVGKKTLRIGARRAARLVQKYSPFPDWVQLSSINITLYKTTMLLPCSIDPDNECMMLPHLVFDHQPEVDVVDKITINSASSNAIYYQDASGKKNATVLV